MSSSTTHPRMSGAASLPILRSTLPWLSSQDTSSQRGESVQREVLVSLVRCITSKKNPRSGRSSSSPCQLLELAFQSPPPSPPSLPVGGGGGGGVTGVRDDKGVPCATVEVYSSETSQWYTADPLPAPYYYMSSVTIADTCYPLGGADADNNCVATVLYASLASLVQKATSPTHQSASHTSVWKTLPDTPLKASAAASLSGNLLAVGGRGNKTTFPAVNIFIPLTNSWVRITTGDLSEPRASCTAVQLSSNTMIVIGGEDNQDKRTKTVFIGTITV